MGSVPVTLDSDREWANINFHGDMHQLVHDCSREMVYTEVRRIVEWAA